MESKSLIDFNKEILLGFVGAIIAAPIFSLIMSKITDSITLISISAVAGDIIGGAIFWIGTRMYDQNKQHVYPVKSLVGDIAYFTPAAFVVSVLILYPTIFLISKYSLTNHISTILSVLMSQLAAYLLFITAMNFYRIILIKKVGKKL